MMENLCVPRRRTMNPAGLLQPEVVMKTDPLLLRSTVWMVLLLACGTESAESPAGPRTGISLNQTNAASSWSDPVWLGPILNSSASDQRPAMTANELTLYFAS